MGTPARGRGQGSLTLRMMLTNRLRFATRRGDAKIGPIHPLTCARRLRGTAMQSTSNNELLEVTIVCLTINRPWIVEWQLSLRAPYPVRLIILDGTAQTHGLSQEGTRGRCRWEYRSAPNVSYLNRLKLALEMVTSPYLTILDDEEAYLFPGIVAAKEFLDCNTDFSGCAGTVSYLQKIGEGLRLTPWRGRRTDWSTPFLLDSIEASQRFERLFGTGRSYNVLNSVIRTSALAPIIKFPEDELADWCFSVELSVTALLLKVGKFACKAFPFGVRAGGSSTAFAGTRAEPTIDELRTIAEYAELADKNGFIYAALKMYDSWALKSVQASNLAQKQLDGLPHFPISLHEVADSYLKGVGSTRLDNLALMHVLRTALETHRNLEGR